MTAEAASQVKVIGRLAVLVDGIERSMQPGQRQLLALLVAVGPAGASPDRLADEIWGERLPANWPNSLRVAVHRLRKRSGLPVISDGGRYRLDLPAAAVDAWTLHHVVERDQPVESGLDDLLAGPDCFPSVELSPSLIQASADIAADQRRLIDRLAADGRPRTHGVLARVAAHAVANPLDDALVETTVDLHVRSGASGAALTVIDRCRDERRQAYGLPSSPELDRLEAQIRSRVTSTEPSSTERPRPTIPRRLERYRADRLVGRDDLLDRICDLVGSSEAPAVVVDGPAGSGKTALLAEAAVRLGADHQVVYLAGLEVGGFALAPLTTALPDFAATLGHQPTDTDDRGARVRDLVARLLSALGARAAGRRILLVVDDAHWLDSATCDVLHHLVRAELGQRVVRGLLVAARPIDDETMPWAGLEAAIERGVDATHLPLEALTVADLGLLVGELEPDLSLTARHHKALWLHRASAGLPEVARRIIELGLAEVGFGEGDDHAFRVYDRLVGSVDEPTRQVGVAAAVMGPRFRLSDLSSLLERSTEELFDAVDRLVERRLVSETGSFDHFEFSHHLIVDAFLRSVSRGRRARLHQRASTMALDVHALARHHLLAGDLCDPAETLDRLVASAEAFLAEHEFWESVAEFRNAIGLAGASGLGPESYVSYARALSLSGARRSSRAVRERAFTAAAEAGRWDLALDAACSGLPEAEVPDGDQDRLEHLERIPPQALSPSSRVSQALFASRQAALLGRVEVSRDWALRAAAEAETDHQRAEAALARWFADTGDTGPARRRHELEQVVGPLDLGVDLPPSLACRVAQARAVDLLESGSLEAAAGHHRRFSELAATAGEGLRHWHGLVFGALLHELRGEFGRADALADDAQERARHLGVAQADVVRLAQQFFRLEVSGRLEALVDLIELIPGADADSHLFSAATTRVLTAAGRTDEAVERAGRLADELLDRPSATSHGSIALLAPALAEHRSDRLKRGAMAVLEPFRDSSLVLGVGLGLIPSVEHLWLLLDGGPERSEAALACAIDRSDQVGFRAWSVRYRLDLAARTGSAQLLTEARDRARAAGLSAVLPDADRAA